MLKSIRWTLQVWHAAILALALGGFGAATYLGIRGARYHQIDAELEGAAQVLAAKVHVRREPGSPPPSSSAERPWATRPPRRAPGEFLERDAALPASLLRRYGGGEGEEPYFVIWHSNGDTLKASRAGLDVPDPGPPPGPPGHAPPATRVRLRGHGDLREVVVYLPAGVRVVVGVPVARERAELHRLLWLLVATGTVILGIGLAGGWVFSLRAIRPIHAIGQTAAAISASNLSRRIDVAGTYSELATLAGVLNATFDRLEGAFDQQVRFTADASHELRTPLAVIHSNVELALSRPRSADEYRQTLETCLKATRRMRGLIDSLLLLARADAGKLELDRRPFDLAAVADECALLVGPLAAEKKVTLETDLAEAEMVGDAGRVGQVVMNLLTNAIHYNREGGQVRVAARPDGEVAAVVAVSDTGLGIAPEDQPHLFDRFYRVDKARSRAVGGSGLGLAICKSIVEAHGGTIALRSDSGGTTFTVRFPRGRAGAGAGTAEGTPGGDEAVPSPGAGGEVGSAAGAVA